MTVYLWDKSAGNWFVIPNAVAIIRQKARSKGRLRWMYFVSRKNEPTLALECSLYNFDGVRSY